MKTLCPNLDREDGLETVLEVPIPEETFGSSKQNRSWQSMTSWMRSHVERSPQSVLGASTAEIQLLLCIAGAPLIPLPITCLQPINKNIKDYPIEASMAKYIVQQYIAACGGEKALNSIDSMCATGKVKMLASEFIDTDSVPSVSVGCRGLNSGGGGGGDKATKVKSGGGGGGGGGGEVGGFVLWQKRPELWCLELVVGGYKISAGSDGKVVWRQTPWHDSYASRGPPRPLRRFLQGLCPRSTANLFSNSICMGEKTINGEDCFVLKLDAESSSLRARSSSTIEIIQHTVWGYFSQRTGLLVQLEDSHLLRIIASANESAFWETSMESLIQDYRTIDGVNLAHAGRTDVSLFRFGEKSESHSRTRMEEVWTIEDVDLNIKGLSMDCFLPPGDLKKKEEGCGGGGGGGGGVAASSVVNPRLGLRNRSNSGRIGSSKVVAFDDGDDSDNTEGDE